MSTSDADKLKLKELLNNALTLRNNIKTLNPSGQTYGQAVEKLKELSKESKSLSDQLSMEHGKALSTEFYAFAQFCELAGKPEATEIETYETQLQELNEARNSARALGDKALDGRILELLTNIFSRTGQYDAEIEVIAKACQFDKTVPKTMALLNAYFKKLDYIYQDRDRIYSIQKDDSDAYMKLHINAWEQYLWLKQQPQFPRDNFIRMQKAPLFKLAIYVGSLSNPLISAKDNEVVDIAMEAFDEAFYISDLVNDKEYHCAAVAHKTSMLYRTLSAEQREALLESLKKTEAEFKPINSEIRDLINSIENKAPSLHPEMKENDPKEGEEATATSTD
ncbi:hypothetical protein SAMD00019534_115830 [Acytostelium subglobosum LB1]|uniref:hypothetical protein n=1 Tax=Acytostelium subglobosum LB1 TaxID=1410327 RepID=UPI000644FA11|nr:hypothetical protein SAMD00019534_115830 [Acytostelium subglobosum LB1]GAM28407.1 hypothetical protein SAMD00019534_115830 [Acytostelium subglobosum LB1]|eukprot:XP_012748724.1 hypothetical protein SAMD00019534_115830 [Acytostelium subglobosum LB1]